MYSLGPTSKIEHILTIPPPLAQFMIAPFPTSDNRIGGDKLFVSAPKRCTFQRGNGRTLGLQQLCYSETEVYISGS